MRDYSLYGYPKWYEDAMEELDRLYEQGLITSSDYRMEVRALNRELQEQEEESYLRRYER